METQTETTSTRKPVKGRVDQGQEEVISLETLQNRITKLVELHNHAEAVAQDYKDAIKATAEACGLLAVTVNKYVKAKAGEKFEEAKTKAMQLSLVFEELGE